MIYTPSLREEIGLALTTFQLIEEALRENLDTVVEIIKRRVKDLPLNFSLYEQKDTFGQPVLRPLRISGATGNQSEVHV